MKTRKILFATDFSTNSDSALEYAARLAGQDEASLLIVHVQEPPMVYGDGNFYYGVPEPSEAAMEEMLQKVKPKGSKVTCERRLVDGKPVDAIVELAEQEDVECIVMSSHGRTGIARLLMGSVAEQVVRRASCPVMIVKPKVSAPAVATAGSKP